MPDGSCAFRTPQDCGAVGGEYLGDDTQCASIVTSEDFPFQLIPDNDASGLTWHVFVTESFTVADVDVILSIAHPRVGDLCVAIEHGSTTVNVIQRPGAAGSCQAGPPFGCTGDDYVDLVLDDEGTGGPIEAACGAAPAATSPPSYVPSEPLGAFEGMDSQGFWTFHVWDRAAGNVGQLNGVAVRLTRANAVEAAPALAIPDLTPAGVSHTIMIPGSFPVADLNVGLVIQHSFVGDLCVRLTHYGTTVSLIQRPGSGLSGCHIGAPSGCSGDTYDIVLDDEGVAGSIQSACSAGVPTALSPPNYVPAEPLSSFDGMDAAGAWTLTVADNAAIDVGTLVRWSLHFEPGPVCPCFGDNDGNGVVDVDDLVTVLLDWGCTNPPGPCAGDVNDSGAVDIDDLVAVILSWGPCPR